MNIGLYAGSRPFERARKPLSHPFVGHGVANLTLPSLAALIPGRHRVTLHDEQVAPIDLRRLPDLALITAKTCYIPRVYALSRTLRQLGVPVVIGGCHATLNGDEVARHADAVLLGEAESVMPQLLDDARRGDLQPRYIGAPVDLATVPPPRRDLLQKRYIIDAVGVSRGCSHACRFCCIRKLYGRGVRTRPIGAVVDEIRGLGRHLGFLDENLVADPDYARELFTALLPLRRVWLAQVSVDMLDHPDLIELAGRSGAAGFFFGMESVNQRNLDAVGKLHNRVDRYAELIRRCHAAGVAVGAGMLFGLDHDTTDIFAETLQTLQQIEIDLGYFKIATPYPGTELFASLDAEGRILTRDWSVYDGCFPTYTPTRMTPRQLFEGVRWIRDTFYSGTVMLRRLRRMWPLRLPWWAKINMNRLASDAYRQSDIWGDRYLRSIGW